MAELKINPRLCKRCGWCGEFCPKKVFGPEGEIIDIEACFKCGLCQLLCPEGAIRLGEQPQEHQRIIQSSNLLRQITKKDSKFGLGWSIQRSSLKPGSYFISGNGACVRGALDAGCQFYAGYPITPASEIMSDIAKKFWQTSRGVFIQMEDEIGSMGAVIGASKAGAKSMTATSGPGFSLMQENIGYAAMTNTPCVIINVQRAGPSTGQATRPAFGDMMQAIWGCHGDSPKIVLAPTNAQECYDLTIRAFNLAEMYLTPVIILTDETIAHLRERIKISGEARVFKRAVPVFGDGHELTVTGSTHYPDGLRAASDPKAQQDLLDRLKEKMEKIVRHPIIDINCHPKNEVVIISCGFTARGVAKAVYNLRLDKKIGTIVIKMLWPFPFKEIEAAIHHQTKVLVPEMNQGQLIHLIREVRHDAIALNQTDGLPIEPKTIQNAVKDCLKRGLRQ
ncbi:MAG: 4Fe-4S binding protein [Candidatus Portnoybacteria bacterium]|nr:4Fe-4S binding protein [Candidatus Portnoybacteria bacterium]